MAEKIFKTLDDLVDLLKERGVDIPDASSRDYAKRVLEKHGWVKGNYFNIKNDIKSYKIKKILSNLLYIYKRKNYIKIKSFKNLFT